MSALLTLAGDERQASRGARPATSSRRAGEFLPIDHEPLDRTRELLADARKRGQHGGTRSVSHSRSFAAHPRGDVIADGGPLRRCGGSIAGW